MDEGRDGWSLSMVQCWIRDTANVIRGNNIPE